MISRTEMRSAWRRLNTVKTLTAQAERQLGGSSFPTAAPHRATYLGSSTQKFLLAIEKLHLPYETTMADLGMGLGQICDVAPFKKVVGFEQDEKLFAAAEQIRGWLELDNVSFRCEDFLTADLTGFDLLYFFKPFHAGFRERMRERLLDTRPGTLIISNAADVERQAIFGGDRFLRLFSLDEFMPVRSHIEKFTTYRRI
ncbi:MAG: class I SAM-dependent methyltransferase [Candidatus Margulisiibacteriota bacterium]